ncbi:uncharacterized protein LOC128304494 [Anopheles moucheti]|uniref:uncharacterized protein LOC128304494 n=1 Tax=Anopheles moucheti TaxID=186751 RepID=UPI0022F0E0FD|nr:uncharacterized protein LOC128304494 [Anopheles moucheti]
MNYYYKEDAAHPRIEFVKVEPNDSEHDVISDEEMEDPKMIQRISKFAPKARTQQNPIKKITRVQYYNRNNRGLTTRKFRATAPAYNNDTVKRSKKMSIPMSQAKAIALIKKIKKESCIWDSTSEDYRNRENKGKAWNRVAAHTGFPVEIVRAKWTSILGSFRSYNSRYKKGLFPEGKPRWYAFDLLNFLSNEIEESAEEMGDFELSYVCADAIKEDYEEPEIPQRAEEQIMPQLPQNRMECLKEVLFPEAAPTIENRISENNVPNERSEPSCNEEILRIVRSMSKVLNKMANIGMPVDYGRYVNQHLKGYDDEIRRKTVKGIMDLIMAADEEMSRKYHDRSQITDVNTAKSHKKYHNV